MTIEANTSGASGNAFGNGPLTPHSCPIAQAPRQHARASKHERATHAIPPIGPRYTPHAERSLASPPPRLCRGLPLTRIHRARVATRTNSTVAPPRRDISNSSRASLDHMLPVPGNVAFNQRYTQRAMMATATILLGMMRRAKSVMLQARSTATKAVSSANSHQLVAVALTQRPASAPQRLAEARIHTGHPTNSRSDTARPTPPTKHPPSRQVIASRAPLTSTTLIASSPQQEYIARWYTNTRT